jgi:peptidoglycan/LPS O-acetylase OafA/YrhL
LKGLNPARSPRYESLTVWRGVACLLVVVYHSIFSGYARNVPEGTGLAAAVFATLRRCWIGVPLFFVISGYCVTASADALRERGQPATEFFWRRFRRIYPPYWIWLAATALLVVLVERFLRPGFFQAVLIPDPRGLTKWQWFGNLTLTEIWRFNFTGGVECVLWPPAWTLCYEEQFYGLVGLALLCARRFFFGALASITVAVIAGLFLCPWLGIKTWGLFLDGTWLMFAAGVLVYYAVNHAPAQITAWFALPLGLGALCAAVPADPLFLPKENQPEQTYFAAFCFGILALFLHQWDDDLSRAQFLRPFRYCGEMCYSLYLVHWPVVMLVGRGFDVIGLTSPAAILLITVPACVAVSVILARVFHIYIERRFLNSGAAKRERQ